MVLPWFASKILAYPCPFQWKLMIHQLIGDFFPWGNIQQHTSGLTIDTPKGCNPHAWLWMFQAFQAPTREYTNNSTKTFGRLLYSNYTPELWKFGNCNYNTNLITKFPNHTINCSLSLSMPNTSVEFTELRLRMYQKDPKITTLW